MVLNRDMFIGFVGALLLFASVAGAAEPNPVGNVLLAAGAGNVRIDGDGADQALQKGDAIYAGDTIQTSIGAVVQLKMVDGALLIVNADSRMRIDAYVFDLSNPQQQAAKISVLKGRVRSITGQLGESNHDAFRLNTPIAAIGIRGTDFETSAAADATRVRLNSGAVVISPLGNDCPADGLGACQTANSLLLTEDLESPIAELRVSDSAPRIIQLEEYETPQDAGATDGDGEDAGIISEHQAGSLVGQARPASDDGDGADPSDIDGGADVEAPPDDLVSKIHWGRWYSAPLEGLPTGAELREQGKELVFVNDAFVLTRDNDFSQLQGNDEVSFGLHDSQAVIVGDGSYSPVGVDSGSLDINFAARSFATQLAVSSPDTGGISLSSRGSVDYQGLFRGQEGNMSVYGVISGDSQQAGYLFSHNLDSDLSIQGVTHWVAP